MTYRQTRWSRTYTKELQKKLNFVIDLSLKVDGWYGRNTKDAVRAFQLKYKLVEDGKCGTNTWLKLNHIFYNSYEGAITLRRNKSNIFLCLSEKKPQLEYGILGKREKLSRMAFGYSWITNCGYYNPNDKKSENIDVDGFLHYNGKTISKVKWKDYICTGSFAITMDGKNFDGNKKFNVYNFHTLAPFGRQPRTLIGNTDKKYVSVVIDGRSILSRGFAINHMIELAIELECIQLLNLDGGGSSEAIYNGKIMNKPSDGVERYIGTGIGFKL